MKQNDLGQLFGVPAKYAPKETAGLLVLMSIYGILPSVQILLMSEMVSKISLFFQEQIFFGLYLELFAYLLTILFLRLIGPWQSWLGTRMECLLRLKYRAELVHKCSGLKYSVLEEKSVQDMMARVLRNVEQEITQGFVLLLNLLTIIVRLLGITVIVMRREFWCGILLLVLNIPIIYLAKKNGEATYTANKEASYYNRRTRYFSSLLMGKEAAEERVAFGYHSYIQKQWKDNYNISYKMQINAFLRYFIKTQAYGIIAVLISLVMVTMLIRAFSQGKLSLGIVVTIVAYVITVIVSLIRQFSYTIRELSEKKEYMKDISALLNLEEEEGVLEKPETSPANIRDIEFDRVSFRYPNSNQYILKDVSFRLVAGKKYAFVGENGTGKTTIVKLMTGLYQEYTGEIRINGKELRKYSHAQIKALFSTVHQDFAQYNISVYDNVAVGDVNNTSDNVDKVKECIKLVGLEESCNKLTEGIQTELGKLNQNSEEISTGQWQKLAIARSMMRNAPVRILDEPTASLDPIMEYEIYQQYRKSSEAAIDIFISHRLGSVRFSDMIYVFGQGTIIEQGDFQNLMAQGSFFATMYETQRSWYE